MTDNIIASSEKQVSLTIQYNEYGKSTRPAFCFQLTPNKPYPLISLIHHVATVKKVDLFQVELKLAKYGEDAMGLFDDDSLTVDTKGQLSITLETQRPRWRSMGSAFARYHSSSGKQEQRRRHHPLRIMYQVTLSSSADHDIKMAIHDPVNKRRKRLFSVAGLEWLRRHTALERPCTIRLVVSAIYCARAREEYECVIETIGPWRHELNKALLPKLLAHLGFAAITGLPNVLVQLVLGYAPWRVVPERAVYYDEWDKDRRRANETRLCQFNFERETYETILSERDAWMNYVHHGFELHVVVRDD